MALTKVTQHSLGNSAVTTAKLGTAPFGFANSSANVVFMAANGNIGVGTSTPTNLLDVVGSTDIKLRVYTSGTTNSLSHAGLILETGVQNYILQNFTTATGNGALRIFDVTSNAERLRIAANGHVGIGTSAPSSVLNASSSTNRAYFTIQSTATTAGPEAGISYKTTNREYLNFCDYDSQALRWYDLTAAAERMRITSSGNVGINTTSPSESLTVLGRRGLNRPSESVRRCIEFHTTISTTTSFTDLFQVDVGSFNQAFYYEIIITGSDWSNHSAARAIKRGFHCPNSSYSAHSVVESSGTFGSNIIYDYSLNGNTFNGKLRLDEGSVGLHCYVRLIGRIASYTVYGTE